MPLSFPLPGICINDGLDAHVRGRPPGRPFQDGKHPILRRGGGTTAQAFLLAGRDSSRRDGPIERETVPAGSVSTKSSLKLPISRQRTNFACVQAFSPDRKCLRRSCAREIREALLKRGRGHIRALPLTPPTGERCEAVAAEDLISIDGRPPFDGVEAGEGDSERCPSCNRVLARNLRCVKRGVELGCCSSN